MFVAGCVAVLVLVVVVLAVGRDRKRGQAFVVAGTALGLRYERSASGLRSELSALPCMQTPGRRVFAHALRGADDILSDWREVRRPKERPRHVARTIYATRTVGAALATRCETFADPRPSGFGEIVFEAGGEWAACYARNRRIPEDRLAEFRETARGWIDARLAE